MGSRIVCLFVCLFVCSAYKPGLVLWGAELFVCLLFVQLISQVSSCGEQRQELVGEALSALLEVDHEDDGGTRMVSKAKETFGAACLPLPGELRFVFMFVCCLFNFMILTFFFSLY